MDTIALAARFVGSNYASMRPGDSADAWLCTMTAHDIASALVAWRDAEIDRLRQELIRQQRGTRFAGWFTELNSGMSYRLWEQGGADPEPGYVALYE